MKVTRAKLRQMINEELGSIAVHLRQRGQNDRAGYTSGLYEEDDHAADAQGVVRYTVPWSYDKSPPVITLPDGSSVEFLKVVLDLQGKELLDPDDGGKFIFSLDNFRQSEEDTEEEIVNHMIDVGVSEFYIEQWAEVVGGYSGSEDMTEY